MPVVLVDLRDADLRDRLKRSGPGEIAGRFYADLSGAQAGGLADVPIRILIVLPMDDRLADDAEALALSMLGVDPPPRAIVALVSGEARPHPIPGTSRTDRVLPNEFSRQLGVRFVDLRSPMLSVAGPTSGADRVGTGATDRWVPSFVADLLLQLRQREIFDAVWAAIPEDRPAAVGMRIAALGSGRHRAVADLALRLADELRPDREPDTGHRLPDRWAVESGLLPAAPIDAAKVTAGDGLPATVKGLAAVPRDKSFKILRRRPGIYNDAAAKGVALLEERPDELAGLFERAAGRVGEDGGPWIDPIGAAELDRALGGIVFGDPVALAAEQGNDAAARIGDLLEDAAHRQADGLSAAVLADWLRKDADLVAPMGPAKVAELLRDGDRPWEALHASISKEVPGGPPTGARQWVSGAVQNHLRTPPKPQRKGDRRKADPKPSGDTVTGEAAATSEASTTSGPAAAATPDGLAASEAEHRPPWQVPIGLRWVLGTPIWRNKWIGALYITFTVGLILLAAAQAWADSTGIYLFRPTDPGLGLATMNLIRRLVTLLAVLAVGYLLLSIVVALAVRRWARAFRFAEIPGALASLEAEARSLAVAEVARCAVRRDYARVARAAADTLIQATTRASAVSKQFADVALAGDDRTASDEPSALPPHREIVTTDGKLAGTDAGGIYRIYPLYVTALRALFAASLVSAVRERWPRIRGVFWAETAESITTLTSKALEDRLARVLEYGIERGDLLQNGVDPADELAERLWTDPVIRESALRALHFEPNDPMPILATPADARLLDPHAHGGPILAVPATLEPLVRERAGETGAAVVVTPTLETATAIRVYPFKPGLYDFLDFVDSKEMAMTSPTSGAIAGAA